MTVQSAVMVDALCAYPLTMVAPQARKHGTWWCHLFCEPGDLDVLHGFAKQLGLRRSYFQNSARLPHYDLTPRLRDKALRCGAQEASIFRVSAVMQRWREANEKENKV